MVDFSQVEKDVRAFWKKNEKKIRAAVQDDPKKKVFSFLEGPPTANAPPALHHLEVRTFKDIICKFKYMNGFSVPRKGGWDTHGLPVEVQVEKSLGLKSKKDVETYGMDKFIKKSRESVFSHIDEWNASTEELAYWIDLENPYITLDNDYIESVWWSLKELHKKNLLYEGYKVVPFCTRCGTPLSSHEVSQGYKDVKEDSVYVAFKLRDSNTYILAWTTTPWTLPGNVGLAVGKDIEYVKVALPDGDQLIVAKDKIDLVKGTYEVVETVKGSKLEGLEYEPLFAVSDVDGAHRVIVADFVTTEDGTGVVHTAGMYGEVDYEVCKEEGLPLVHTVGEDGKFLENVPAFLRGKYVKDAEKSILEDLKKRHLLFKVKSFSHSYPFCWRCDTPLLYYAINSWFINVTAVKDKMMKHNAKINWEPGHIKDGRFGKWLENIKDWSLSRFKFWGTPLPIWRCECGEDRIIGSVEELKEHATKKFAKYDLHRPWIDTITLKCECGKKMKRIPDLIDVWYDSGAASFAQFHYPFENKDVFERRFPYDYISEAIDQTRGWFYTLHAIATMLFDKPAYKNVICAGHVVDDKGEKMSKSKGNIIKPMDIIPKSGVDAVRLQFCTTDAGSQKRFSYDLMKESVLPFLMVLYNVNRYYRQIPEGKSAKRIEDKWILSKMHTLVSEVTEDLNVYKLGEPFQKISSFVVNDFSRTYIKMVRDRDNTKDTIGEVLRTVCLLLAPFAPYVSEYIYRNFSEESVHLSNWPKANKKMIDSLLEEEFLGVLEIIEKGLAERDRAKIGLKWPLSSVTVTGVDSFSKELEEIVLQQLNVKKLVVKKGKEMSIALDTAMTPELESEGYAREISRIVQASRKKAGLVKTDRIDLIIDVGADLRDRVEAHASFIKERTNADSITFERPEKKYPHTFTDAVKSFELTIMFVKK